MHVPKPNKTIKRHNGSKLSPGHTGYGPEAARRIRRVLVGNYYLSLISIKGAGYRQVKVLEFFDCTGPQQGVEDLRELLHKVYTTMCEEWGRQTLGVAGTQQQNGLVDETNVTLFANVRCFLIQSGLSKVFLGRGYNQVKCIFLGYHKRIVGNMLWRLDDITSKVVLYRNTGFNESGEYKKTFIGSGVGTGSMQVLHRFKFEVKPLGDHTFEVEPQENIDQGDGLQEVQTQDLMDYQLAHDREQHLACELFGLCWRDTPYCCWRVVYQGTVMWKKNAKWSCIYAVGSQEYQMVCTRLDIASADVGMLDKFNRGLQTDVQVFVDFDYVMGRSITIMESRYELRTRQRRYKVVSKAVDVQEVEATALAVHDRYIEGYEVKGHQKHLKLAEGHVEVGRLLTLYQACIHDFMFYGHSLIDSIKNITSHGKITDSVKGIIGSLSLLLEVRLFGDLFEKIEVAANASTPGYNNVTNNMTEMATSTSLLQSKQNAASIKPSWA
nr:zinc finger, CCHC-type [Tanacetum cinerariifolium]